MESARAGGYSVHLAFVVLRDIELNVLRVAERVMQGGHSIPEATIRRRYAGAFERLPRAITLAHQIIIYDNSSQTNLETLIQIQDGAIVLNALNEASLLHSRIAERIACALDIAADTVFRSAKPV